MPEIKNLKNYVFRWVLIALISVMFAVLLGGYRLHIRTSNAKLQERTAPLQSITNTLLSQSGSSSDDSLIRSTIAGSESMISGLDLMPAVTSELRQYISNLYTVAGAFDAAKNALPQTNDRQYLFDLGTINLLQTNTYFSGDILQLYSGRQTITDAIRYLSGSLISTANEEKQNMSKHNISVAFASQIGVEITLCTQSYTALASGWNDISSLFSGLLSSYQKQLDALASLQTNDPTITQCLATYRTTLSTNITSLTKQMPLISKLASISSSRQHAYAGAPLQCPLDTDLYDDIVAVRGYESDVRALTIQNTLLENLFLTGNLSGLGDACESMSGAGTGSYLPEILSQLSGDQQSFTQTTGSVQQHTDTGSYQALPEDTQQIIDDIYQKNIEYINLMQTTDQDNNYRPLQRLQELFKQFNGDVNQFIK